MPLLALPSEILCLICSHVVSDISWYAETARWISQIARSCHALRIAATPHLYKFCEVKQPHLVLQLFRTICSTPHLAACIRHLDFDIRHSFLINPKQLLSNADIAMIREVIASICKTSPDEDTDTWLQDVLEGSDLDPVYAIMLSLTTNLEKFEVTVFAHQTKYQRRLMERVRKSQERRGTHVLLPRYSRAFIRLGGYRSEISEDVSFPFMLPLSLNEFGIELFNNVRDQGATFAIRKNLTLSIQRLAVDQWHIPSSPFRNLLSCCPKLIGISLIRLNSSDLAIDNVDMGELINILRDTGHLHTLQSLLVVEFNWRTWPPRSLVDFSALLHLSLSEDYIQACASSLALKDLVPKSLETLRILEYHSTAFEALLGLLSDWQTATPKLRSVEVVSAAGVVVREDYAKLAKLMEILGDNYSGPTVVLSPAIYYDSIDSWAF